MHRRKYMEKNKFSIMVIILLILNSCICNDYIISINDRNIKDEDTIYHTIISNENYIFDFDTLTKWNYKNK